MNDYYAPPTQQFPPVPPNPPNMVPPSPPRRSPALPIVGAVFGALALLAGAGAGGYFYFGSSHNAKPLAAVPPANAHAMVQQQPQTKAPNTVVVVPPKVVAPPPVTVTQHPPAVDYTGGSSGEFVSDSGNATPYSCTSDGDHLYAGVTINSTTDVPANFIGTVQFYDSGGTWIGQGGFSAASLASGSSIEASVDTGDPNDPRASEGDLTGTAGAAGCVVSDLHTK